MESGDVAIKPLRQKYAEAMLQLLLRNRAFLEPFEPKRDEAFYTLEEQAKAAKQAEEDWESGAGYGFGIFLEDSQELIGRISLRNVSRGAWQSCTLGYFLDQANNGKGYMTQAAKLIVGFALEEAGLHRVQAAVMPRNLPSIRVLEKVGFAYEGYAKFYLRINGIWEDHKIYSITSECWP
jgi:[ribosomal protein S5]-alanine N-acetyltransferase